MKLYFTFNGGDPQFVASNVVDAADARRLIPENAAGNWYLYAGSEPTREQLLRDGERVL